MIRKGLREVTGVRMADKAAVEIRRGLRLVWSAMRGIFSLRLWIRGLRWRRSDFWLTK